MEVRCLSAPGTVTLPTSKTFGFFGEGQVPVGT